MVKTMILGIAVGLSLIVSIGLMLNIHEPGPAPAQQPEPQPAQQLEQKQVQEVADQKLYTKEQLATNPELYTHGEAWDIMRAEYTDTMQFCNSLDDVITENECVTATTTLWLEIEDILERIYQ